MFGCLLGWYTISIYIFGGSCPHDRILPGAKFTLRPNLAFTYISAALLHSTLATGVSQTLRRRTRNRIMELSHRAPLIFSRMAITFGFGPHSSLLWPPFVADVDMIFLPCVFLWSPYVIGQTIIFSSCSFFLPSSFYRLFFPRLISAVGDWMSTILLHMTWP